MQSILNLNKYITISLDNELVQKEDYA